MQPTTSAAGCSCRPQPGPRGSRGEDDPFGTQSRSACESSSCQRGPSRTALALLLLCSLLSAASASTAAGNATEAQAALLQAQALRQTQQLQSDQIKPVDIPTPRWTVYNTSDLLVSPNNVTGMYKAARAKLFQSVQSKAATLVANITNPLPTPAAVLSTAAVPAAAPAPAISVLPAPQKTAVRVDLRISGTGVTPFDAANQQRLLNVLADATTNISMSSMRIILVSDAYTFRRRSLLQLANVADVTLEVDAGTTANAPFVLAQLSSVIVNNSIAISLQQHGLKDWSVQLLSIVTTVPSSGTPAALPCQSAFGKWCLDGTFWSPAAIVTLIAFGAAIVVLLAIALIVYREVRRRSGLTGELEMPKPEASITRMERLRRYVLKRPLAEVNGEASSPVQKPPLTPPKKVMGAPPRK